MTRVPGAHFISFFVRARLPGDAFRALPGASRFSFSSFQQFSAVSFVLVVALPSVLCLVVSFTFEICWQRPIAVVYKYWCRASRCFFLLDSLPFVGGCICCVLRVSSTAYPARESRPPLRMLVPHHTPLTFCCVRLDVLGIVCSRVVPRKRCTTHQAECFAPRPLSGVFGPLRAPFRPPSPLQRVRLLDEDASLNPRRG